MPFDLGLHERARMACDEAKRGLERKRPSDDGKGVVLASSAETAANALVQSVAIAPAMSVLMHSSSE